jgi:hypothetical protein
MEQGAFTGLALADCITGTGTHAQFVKARRIINGTDRAGTSPPVPTQSRRRWARGPGLMPGLAPLALASALAACLTGIGGYAYGVHVGTAQEQAAQKARDDARETLRQQARSHRHLGAGPSGQRIRPPDHRQGHLP